MSEKKNTLSQQRTRIVVASNDLLLKSRFSLTARQQKIILYLISKISPFDTDFQLYDFSISEFCRCCGIDASSGNNYRDMKKAIKDIADKSIWIQDESGQETLLRWIEKPYINRQKGIIQIRFDNDMKPFLLQLQKNFTQFELLWTLRFQSKYAFRLYELIKSIHYYELDTYTKTFDIDELRKLLDAKGYTTYQSFKERVLEPACEEINAYSEKTITYRPIKNKLAVTAVELTVSTKEVLDRLRLQMKIEEELDCLADVKEEGGKPEPEETPNVENL